MVAKRALITGASGQDGAYLSRHLLDKGYEVFGAIRRGSSTNNWRLQDLDVVDKVRIVEIELLEYSNILRLIGDLRPFVIFNLAAQSFVASSFQIPIYTADVNGLGVLRLLDAIRTIDSSIRFYQASTSEMFGKVRETPQRETTPFHPRSPYAAAKLFAHSICVNYRESYGIHATSGILFNHESPLRGREFVTRKITSHFALYKRGLASTLELGNMDAMRDWGHARDYVEGMVQMMEHDRPDTFLLASGRTHSVRSFVEIAGKSLDMDLVWEGEGMDLRAVDRKTNNLVVKTSPQFYRPAEVDILLGDSTKARTVLGWKPKTSFEDLVEEMVKADLARVDAGKPLL